MLSCRMLISVVTLTSLEDAARAWEKQSWTTWQGRKYTLLTCAYLTPGLGASLAILQRLVPLVSRIFNRLSREPSQPRALLESSQPRASLPTVVRPLALPQVQQVINSAVQQTIIVRFLSEAPRQVPFNPDERVWQFSRGAQIPGVKHFDSETNPYLFIYNGQPVNTCENRMQRVGDLITDPSKGLHAMRWDLSDSRDVRYLKNSSSKGADRSECAVCIDEITSIRDGERDNPLISITIGCGHTFHQGCLQNLNKKECPTCREAIS